MIWFESKSIQLSEMKTWFFNWTRIVIAIAILKMWLPVVIMHRLHLDGRVANGHSILQILSQLDVTWRVQLWKCANITHQKRPTRRAEGSAGNLGWLAARPCWYINTAINPVCYSMHRNVNKARCVKAEASKPRPRTQTHKAKAENAKVNFLV